MTLYQADKKRNSRPPVFQKYWRTLQETNSTIITSIYSIINKITQFLFKCEFPVKTNIGPGLYIGHPYCITINPDAIIGKNCNIHKGVTIGQENRGIREGTPKIGNDVWIGVNATIVGKIIIGDDVLIAPNSYVNRDVPSHSIVFGNPCIIKHKDYATEGYIHNRIILD